MYKFVYFFILSYTSILFSSVNTYVVLATNLNDLKTLAKKYAPNKNLGNQVKVMVLETDLKKNNRETLEDEENIDKTVEDVNENSDPYEILKQMYVHPKKPPKVSFLLPQDTSPKTRLTATKTSNLDELIDKLKHGILQEIIDNKGDDNADLKTQINNALAHQLKAAVNKNVQNKPKKQIKKSVPMKIFKEEVQFEGSYEDTTDKNEQPQIHYLGQVQIPTNYLNNKPVNDFSYTKTVVPKKFKFTSPKHLAAGKKVRYVKQVLVPADSNNVLKSMWQQPNQEPNLGQQTDIVKETVLQPQASEMQLPLDQQPSIIKQLALMQHKIDQLHKIVQQNLADNKQNAKSTINLETPKVAGEVSFKIVSSSNSDDEDQEAVDSLTSDNNSQTVEESLFIETTTEASVDKTSTDNVPTISEDEEVIEVVNFDNEVTPVVTDNGHDAKTDATTEKVKEISTNDEQKTIDDVTEPAEAILIKADNAAILGEVPKKHTQEFGNPAAGEPIVEKTYNFNVPVVEAKEKPTSLKLPANSARKVLLF